MNSILVGKTFGIGNAVCAIPMLRALRARFPDARIDLLLGTTPDDFGAAEIFSLVQPEIKFAIFQDSARSLLNANPYDVAIMSTPFDGRWQNGVHFNALKVMDCRPRPDPSTMGFSSWKKHEVEYQMENAYELGYVGEIPSITMNKPMMTGKEYYGFDVPDVDPNFPHRAAPRSLYVGIGYKRDEEGFWAQKHWGNDMYAMFIRELLREDPGLVVVSSGNFRDFIETMRPISRAVNDPRYFGYEMNLKASIALVNSCDMYIGNDTGMAHIAAGCERPTGVLFKMAGASTKSHPWCKNYEVIEGADRYVSVSEMLDMYRRLREKSNQQEIA